MSQTESRPLGTFFISLALNAPGSTAFRCLAELAARAFILVEGRIGLDTSDIPLTVKNHMVRIFYNAGSTDAEYVPIRASFQQVAPATQVLHVDVDFEAKTAACEGQPDLVIEAELIERAWDEAKVYLQNICKLGDVEKEHRVQECNDWRDFIGRLTSKGMLPSELYGYPFHFYVQNHCPLCHLQTVSCTSCHVIMCTNSACEASKLVPFQSCSQHPSTASCIFCLKREHEKINPSRLAQCPVCALWFCQFELTWCIGRPKDSTNRLLNQWHRPIPNSDRVHPIKPIRCFSCAGGQDKPHCANQTCWSRWGGWTSICDACSPGGGLWCTCEQCWVCDDCKTSPTGAFKHCPRCKRVYCAYECEYIQFCSECGRTTLCDDCVEEDWSGCGGKGVGDEVVLRRCSTGCKAKICGECMRGARYAGCRSLFCTSCTREHRAGVTRVLAEFQ